MITFSTKAAIGMGVTSMLLVWTQAMCADTVYKCVKNGRINYTSHPSAKNGQCQEKVIRNDGPNPEDLARLLEQKKIRQEAENKAREAAMKEREIRAKELAVAAAERRARAVEEQLLLLQQTPAMPTVVESYPFFYPYWGVMPGPMPNFPGNGFHRFPNYEVPRQPWQPIRQPSLPPPNGPVRRW